MSNYFEVDFLGVETKKSGDAITLRYSINGVHGIHVIDGGYIDTGAQIIEHINKFYGSNHVNNVILTHPDRDHANGLRKVLEECSVDALWMNRPWLYAEELLPRFATYKSVDALRRKLKDLYSATATLEQIAVERGIPIYEAFQGADVGPFRIMAPTRSRYLDCVAESEKTPELAKAEFSFESASSGLFNLIKKATNYIKAVWGDEYFPPEPTSYENEMSVVQYACINNKKILLTGDAGREALREVIDYAPSIGLLLPGIDFFQVPHHGGRHNVSTEVLDELVGPRLDGVPEKTTWNAICSSAKEDSDHPRKTVVRAMIHRGAHFVATEGKTVNFSNGISREGWVPIPQTPYPSEQEE